MAQTYWTMADLVSDEGSEYKANKRVAQERLEKIAHGIYAAADTWPDELYLLQLENSKIIYSYETALYIHGLTDRESDSPVVTVKRGYNASHLKARGVIVHTVIADWYELGITQALTSSGNTIRLYDKERCICDIIRDKKNMDIQIYQSAIQSYFRSQDKNIHKLMQYGKEMKISDKLRVYTEILL